ncbi:MAG: nickel pincer cofactor biosynthesis protein LarC [Acidobacteriota bacterium]
MKILYLDCASGVSGDMLLGALIDLGLDPRWLRGELGKLPLEGYTVTTRRITRGGLAGCKVYVKGRGRHAHRGLRQIRQILSASPLSARVRRTAMAIFRRIIRVEARIHRIPEQRVRLHEIGAVDSIIDIVGTVIGLDRLLDLGISAAAGRLVCSPLNVGSGTVRTEHGLLPVPAPATAALLKGVPIYSAGPPGERVTPTGAAIVSSLASEFGPPPPMIIEKIGYGAGARDFEDQPNLLRALAGSSWRPSRRGSGRVAVIECTIDDMNPQGYGYLMERLFDSGAKEVFYTPVQMKKGRPGILVTVICSPGRLNEMARIVFEETTTIGIRHRTTDRIELERDTRQVRTRFGKVRVKVSRLDGRMTQVLPEYEDCRRLAARRKVPLKQVQAAAVMAFGEAGP